MKKYESSDGVCLPEQAIYFKEQKIIQLSYHAWSKRKDWMLLCDLDENSGLVLLDWEHEKKAYAAFDNTQLGIMLQTLGYYPSGPTLQITGIIDNEDKWWCDDVNNIIELAASSYATYGKTEPIAKAAMLQKLIHEGKIPIGWPFFDPKRTSEIFNNLKKYGTNDTPGDLHQ